MELYRNIPQLIFLVFFVTGAVTDIDRYANLNLGSLSRGSLYK